jgi:hypothetical protein
MPSPPTWIALGLILLALLIALVLAIDLKRCVSRLETLGSPEQIAIYRSAVARQMYGALAVLALAILAAIVMTIGTALHYASYGEWLYVIVPGIIFAGVGVWTKSIERKAQAIPADGDFARQRDAIVHVWLKRPLPNW